MKISKAAFFFILIFFIGGIGGVFMDHYILPHLAATRLFSKYDFLRQYSEGVTVINRTEQVLVKEDASVEKISSQVASSMVNILSYKKMDAKNGTGVIATSDGLIMTYASAIIPDATYKVTIFDGRI
ncbi:MAG: hypothetical protein NTZ97_02180, partial [Candidatus Moranbacteria bacterium]|nr:hypothetical protein [Candidatus Moranbacteria bacterium]